MMATSWELLARVDALLPSIAARADDDDRNGQVSDVTIEELAAAGVFAALAPKAYGGFELDLDVFSAIVQKISAVSPSTGWVCSFLMGASWRLLTLGREGQVEIFGAKNHVLGAGTAAPIFDVRKVDGGYRLTGRTAWNSGSSHAEWFQMNGLLKNESGPPEMVMFAIPRSDVAIVDTWHILGMKGTASRDLVVDDLFVPNHLSAPFAPALEGRSAGHRLHDNRLYHVPFLPFAMTEVLPVVVGTHRGAANALRERVKSRMGTLSGAKAAEKVPAQIRMAQALARADMAEQMLSAMIATISADQPDAAHPMARAATKLHAAMVTNFCLDSVNDMARSVGGDAFRDEAPFQRFFRDINTVGRHAFLDPDTAGESYGKLQLGLPVADPVI
jgi:3-hydroxy-9,10-secoandrosta-1,3,5(10)-triene-9,17-dione monooxygenase